VSIRYRADIDGLRAVAVLPVVLYHAHLAGFSGGFVGVDVFFVISGFLICSLIVEELRRGEFSILRFYERRCRRILPALFAMFLGTSALACVVLMPPDLASYGSSLLSSLAFVSNVYFWKVSGYFDGSAEFKPLLHTWSLSVEEQFYLVVPYLLLGICALFKKRYLTLLVPFALGSLALSDWAVSHAPNAAFYLLPTRFWEILLGGLLAVSSAQGPARRPLREGLALVGLLGILGATAFYSDETRFPGLAALAPCMGAALIIYAGLSGESLVGRLLSSAPFTFVGKISYSLYLWHWPLFALYRYRVARELTSLESVVLVALGFALAVASWHFVERPFRQARGGVPRRLVFVGAGAGAVAAATFAGTALATNGLPSRVPGFEIVAAPGEQEYDAGGSDDCFLGDPQTFADWGGERCFVTRGRGPRVLLWGDSFAAHYVPGLAHQAEHLHADFLQYNLSACPPVFGFDTMSSPSCRAFNDHVADVIRDYGIQAVVVSSRWDYAFKRHVQPSDIRASLERLRGLGVAVSVIGQSPLFGNQVQTLFAQSGGARTQSDGWGQVSFSADLNHKLAASLPDGVTFIDPLEHLCQLPACRYRDNRTFLFSDEGHFSAYGSELAVARYFPYFDRDEPNAVSTGHPLTQLGPPPVRATR
jgi:peptidoglycan/LPS O-acetylase OafA/YrhL